MRNPDEGGENDDKKQPDWLESGPQPGKTDGEIGVPDTSLHDKLTNTAEMPQSQSELDLKRAIDATPKEKKLPNETPFLPNKFRNAITPLLKTFIVAPLNEHISALYRVMPELAQANRQKRHENMPAKDILVSTFKRARKMMNFEDGTGKLPPLKFNENEHSKEIAKLCATEICAHPSESQIIVYNLKYVLVAIFNATLKTILNAEDIPEFTDDIKPFMETQFKGLIGEIINALSWPNYEIPVNRENLTREDLQDWLEGQKDTLLLFE